MDAQTFDIFRYRFAKYILIGVTILLVLFLLLAFARIGFIFWLWSTVETWVTVRLGLDYYAAQLLTMIVVSIVTLLLPSLAWYLLLGKKKAWGTGAMIGGQALVFILVYTIGQGVCFDRRTGAPLCWYADTPEGRQFSFTPGFHPRYGIEYRQYTREMALESGTRTTPTPIVTPTVRQTERVVWEGSVNPRRRWQSTGVEVRRGETIQITASGSVTWATNVPSPYIYVSPNGTSYSASMLDDTTGFPSPEAGCGSLIMRIGSSIYPVGGNATILSRQNGTIEFMVNDRVYSLSDNSGNFHVTVRKR